MNTASNIKRSVTKTVLFVNIPHTSRLSHFDKKVANIHFPIGLAYIMNTVRSQCQDYDFSILDLNFWSRDEESIKKYFSANYKYNLLPDFVLFGAMSTNYKQVKNISRILKSLFANIKLVCGGTIATIHSQLLLEKLGIDICVIGEGEETIVELLKCSNNLRSIKGIAFLDKGEYVKTSSRERVGKIQSLVPVYRYFNMEGYISSYKHFQGYRGVMVSGSRGCYYKCEFCVRPFGKEIIYRKVDEIVDEISFLTKTYKIEYFFLCDELPWSNKKWMNELATCLIDNKINVMWVTAGRVNQFSYKDRDLLKLAKKSGLVRICFGVESASKKILQNMKKVGVSTEKAKKTFRLLREIGIKPSASIVMGYPGETPETIQETVSFLKENLLVMKSFFILQPYPGTEVYEKYVKNGIGEEDWLEKYSHEGDASRITVNLTNMSDEEFMYNVSEAVKQVCKRSLLCYFKYYALKDLPKPIVVDIYRYIRMKVTGAYFETP